MKSAPTPPMIDFVVERRVSVDWETLRTAAHAMGLVWSRYMPGKRLRLRLIFDDAVRHPVSGADLGVQAIYTPGAETVVFAYPRIRGALGPAVAPAIAIIPSAAHEMMHVVQQHRGDSPTPSFDVDGSLRAGYEDAPSEREARQVGLDVLKSMVPSITGHSTTKANVVEVIPDEGTFGSAEPYRILLAGASALDRLRIALGVLRDPLFPFWATRAPAPSGRLATPESRRAAHHGAPAATGSPSPAAP